MSPWKEKFLLIPTKTFEKDVIKESKKTPHLKNKICNTLNNLQRTHFKVKKLDILKLPNREFMLVTHIDYSTI